HRQLVGSLAIGLIGNAPMEYNALMGRAIQRFRQRDEAVRLSVLVRGPRELEEMLLRDELQVAVGYFLHRAPALEYTLLFSE
ncbi:LysR substrate-binding domain-containing protein, partial [Salmonella enterica]